MGHSEVFIGVNVSLMTREQIRDNMSIKKLSKTGSQRVIGNTIRFVVLFCLYIYSFRSDIYLIYFMYKTNPFIGFMNS